MGSCIPAVSANHKHHVDTPQVETVHHLGDLCGATARGAEDGAALKVDAVNGLPVEDDGLCFAVIESHEAVADSVDLVLGNAVVGESVHNVLQNIIETRAQPAARDDCCLHLCWLKVDCPPSASAGCEWRQRDACAMLWVGDSIGALSTLAVKPAVMHRLQPHPVLVKHKATAKHVVPYEWRFPWGQLVPHVLAVEKVIDGCITELQRQVF
mmetsp:Transcript_36175/g.102269  ORF Transcript_36175/g.102269 Transcript_36175/m.102269 type:complete len:211 (+) Transcript_36175:1040-1672(+)